MRSILLAAAAAFSLLAALPTGAVAQSAVPSTPAAPARSARPAKPTREPTVGQLAARERLRKCAVEWKDAKAKSTTGGLKWPQYYSKCNARLKGGTA